MGRYLAKALKDARAEPPPMSHGFLDTEVSLLLRRRCYSPTAPASSALLLVKWGRPLLEMSPRSSAYVLVQRWSARACCLRD